jgi:hypothetical protein
MRGPRRALAGATIALAIAGGGGTAAAAVGPGGALAPSESGGAQFDQILGHAIDRPVASVFQVPASVVSGKAPRIRLRIDHPHDKHVTARIVVLRTPGNDPVARIALGRIRTGRTVTVRWPKGVVLTAGEYLVRVHARDARNHVLERRAKAAGRSTMTVTPAPVPATPPAPETGTTTAPATAIPMAPVVPGGVFPVAGPHTYGDGVGAQRNGHIHQGQDIPTSAGTPVVAPTAGTIAVTSYQAGGAGYYVVEDSADGRSFFFAHCQKDSFGVSAGQAVAPGTRLCGAGATGDAEGVHLHFEIWVGGWRTSATSRFENPLAQLQAWDHA